MRIVCGDRRTPPQHIGDVELRSRGLDVQVFHRFARIAPDDLEADPRQRRAEFLRNPFSKICLVVGLRQVGEGQNSDPLRICWRRPKQHPATQSRRKRCSCRSKAE
jgi:hypothetical protein